MTESLRDVINQTIKSSIIGTCYHRVNKKDKEKIILALSDVLVDIALTSNKEFRGELDEMGKSMTKEVRTILFSAFTKSLHQAGVKKGLREKIQREINTILAERERLNKDEEA